jgi:hypothetical protein
MYRSTRETFVWWTHVVPHRPVGATLTPGASPSGECERYPQAWAQECRS